MEKYEMVGWITARGGSRRLPRKNVKILLGKPMIAYAIEACVGSKYISRTFVSTEDKEIKEISLKYGAEVIDRPPELSEDDVPQHYANWHWHLELLKENYQPDLIVATMPTMPMVTTRHVNEAIELYMKSKSMYLFAVCQTYNFPDHLMYINDAGLLAFCFDRQRRAYWQRRFSATSHYNNKLKKDKEIYYGASLVNIVPYITAVGPIGEEYVQPYIVSPIDAIDVNTLDDFRMAEYFMKERIKKEKIEKEKENKGG